MPKRSKKQVRFILVSNPENRRVQYFQQALHRYGIEPATVVPYVEFLKDDQLLDRVVEATLNSTKKEPCKLILRIESPGENFEVDRRLIALGATSGNVAERASKISRDGALRLREDRGRIRYPAQWFAGFLVLLEQVAACLASFPSVVSWRDPLEIGWMFDKSICHQMLSQELVSVPPALYSVESFEELIARMKEVAWNRVFVKLATGSSASGIVALYSDGQKVRAITSMERIGVGSNVRYYNNLKLRTYHRHQEIERAIDFLCKEKAHVEKWLPKAMHQGRNFDLRVVAIEGRACHSVVRTSRSPITNLHLGNKRGDIVQLRKQMGRTSWNHLQELVERTALVFPKSQCMGIDILMKPGLRSAVVLEVNAFGDLLPGITHQGKNAYESQVLCGV